MEYYYAHPDNWRDCLNYIQEYFGYDKYPGVCHIIPNLCVMIMGMCYGKNDFSKTLTIINQSGWDTDCNCGNVGSIMGALVGIEGIDNTWITPINDVVNSSSCIGYLNIQTISASSKLFAKLAFKLQGIEIVDDALFDLPYATNGFRDKDNIKVKNNELLVTGNKVYNYSYYMGKDIYDSRYVS
jgi:ADP-ribosylglycohydrolase.